MMSTSKFAGLEGVDYAAPDIFETRSPSPSRRNKGLRGGARGSYGSSDDDSDDDGDGSSGADDGDDRYQRRGNKKISGHGGTSSGLGRDGAARKQAGSSRNPDIESVNINADEAAKRFRGATGLDSGGVDFTNTIQRRKKKPQYYPRTDAMYETGSYSLGSGTGYRTVHTADEDGDEDAGTRRSGQQETPLDKFRRLRYEMQELEKELKEPPAAQQGVGQDDAAREAADLLPQLQALREHAASLEDSDSLKDAQPNGGDRHWQEEARRLLGDLSQTTVNTDGHQAASRGQTAEQQATASSLSDVARVTDVDQRLAGLEDLVGIRLALQDEAKSIPRPLLPSLARIEHLLTLLTQPRHLDGISRRIKVLVSELERAHEARRKLAAASGDATPAGLPQTDADAGGSKSSTTLPAETLKRLDGVLPLLAKIEPMLPVVPTLLSRLQTLSVLHAGSATFVHDVEALTGLARATRTQNDELASMLTNVEQSLGENDAQIKDNLGAVQERIDGLMKRVDALK